VGLKQILRQKIKPSKQWILHPNHRIIFAFAAHGTLNLSESGLYVARRETHKAAKWALQPGGAHLGRSLELIGNYNFIIYQQLPQ